MGCRCYDWYKDTCASVGNNKKNCKRAGCKYDKKKKVCAANPKDKAVKCKKIKFTLKSENICQCFLGCEPAAPKEPRRRRRGRRAGKEPVKKCSGTHKFSDYE